MATIKLSKGQFPKTLTKNQVHLVKIIHDCSNLNDYSTVRPELKSYLNEYKFDLQKSDIEFMWEKYSNELIYNQREFEILTEIRNNFVDYITVTNSTYKKLKELIPASFSGDWPI